MQYKLLFVFASALALSAAVSSEVLADLSGSKGKMRAMGGYPGDGCGDLFDRYIDASGHSAYATTVTDMDSGAVCGIALNRRTVEQAERDAVNACEDGNAKWKVEQLGGCYVGASK